MSDVRPVGTEYKILTDCVDPDTGKEAMVFMVYRVVEHVLSGDGVIERVAPVGKPVPAESKTPTRINNIISDETLDAREIERVHNLVDQTYTHIDHCTYREAKAMEDENYDAAHNESRLYCNLIENYFGILNAIQQDDEDMEE